MKRSSPLFLLILATLLLWQCSKNTNEPPPPVNNEPDTTSHNFVWRIDTLGEGPQYSSLRDVAIIGENDIWVVGDIRMADTYQQDSLGNIIQPYNAAHWDGNEWELVRIFYYDYGQQWLIQPIRGILPMNNHQFWLAAGSIFYWGGGLATLSYRRNIGTPELITNLWGNSTVYGAGNAGILVAYDGNSWQEIDTHTDINLTDIWGQVNQSDSLVLYATVSTENNDRDSKVLKIADNIVTEVSSEGLPNDITGIWFDERAGYYVVGDGIFYTRELNDSSQWTEIEPDITGYFTNTIAANDSNDIIIAGHFGTVVHYNGSTWKNYSNIEIPSMNGVFSSVKMREDIVVIVGDVLINSTKGIVLTGKRLTQ